MVQGEDNIGIRTDNLAGRHPIRTIGALTSIIPTSFMPDALPAASQFILVGIKCKEIQIKLKKALNATTSI